MLISRCAAGSLAFFVAVALVLATGITPAAETEFIPKVEFSVGRQGNVTFVGQRSIPDDFLRIGLHFGFASETERTSFDLNYRPSRVYYREFTELDFTEHRFSANLDRSLSPASNLQLNALFYSGQGQGIDPDQPDSPVTLVPRTDRDLGTVTLRQQTAGSERSTWTWDFGVTAVRYDNTLGTSLEDADTLLAELKNDRALSERVSVGGSYEFQFFQYVDSGWVKVHTVMAVTDYAAGQFTDLRVGLGGFHAEFGSERISDPAGELFVTREVGERNRLSAGISQRVSVGTGLERATLDRGGYIAWNVRVARAISATVNLSYWRREDLESLQDATNTGTRTFLTSETLTWKPHAVLALGVYHRYDNQEALGSADPRLDTGFHSGGITLLWSPRVR